MQYRLLYLPLVCRGIFVFVHNTDNLQSVELRCPQHITQRFFDNRSGFLINNPLIVFVFLIAANSYCGQTLSCVTLAYNNSLLHFGNLLCIEVINYIVKRSKLVCSVDTIHVIGNRNKSDIVLQEKFLGVLSNLIVISTESG